jgi:hypothetical protein
MLTNASHLTLLGLALGPLACSPTAAAPDAPSTGDSGTASADVELEIAPGENVRAISTLIYGINGASAGSQLRSTLVRLGGNPAPAYNWEVNATNGGRVEGFTNRAASEGEQPGAAAKEVIDQATANGAAAMLTIPIGDFVAADKLPGDVQKSGADYLETRFRKNEATKGAPFSPTGDPADDTVHQDEFLAWVKGVAGDTPVVLGLDNQPELWAEDHAHIHPAPATYEESVTRGVTYSKALKAVWPGVPVTGSVSYGWLGFISFQNAPGSQGQGEFLSYYLAQMQAAEVASGQRLLDYLDTHWWPEAQGDGERIISAGSSPAVVEARLQAPRSLWDPSYREVSWISDWLEGSGETIALIPRLKSRIDQHYPDTRLAFSAWYFGGGNHISGAIATADVLGIFGREGVDLAAVELSDDEDDAFTLAGFRAFLDYDGAGASFGDTSVSAVSSNPTGVSVYASTASDDPERLVVVALNKQPDAVTAKLDITGPTQYATCAVYALTASSAAFVPMTTLSALGTNEFRYPMPGLSVSILVPKR